MPIYDEIWDGPGRNIKRVNGQPQSTTKWYVTIHNTSNNATAAGEAKYARVRTDGVGAHFFIDNLQVLQSTDTDWCVGHVGSAEGNSRGISYEITGVNAWTREQWMANVAWDKLAAVIARDCRQFGIPVRLLTIEQMRAFNSANKGFVTHDMARRAWGGTTHNDPGPGFPMDHLLALVAGLAKGRQMLFQVAGDTRIYVPKGDGYVHLTSGAALIAMQNAGHRIAVFPTLADMETIAGKPWAEPKPAPVVLTPADREAIAASVVAKLPAPPTAQEIAKATLDEDHARSKE